MIFCFLAYPTLSKSEGEIHVKFVLNFYKNNYFPVDVLVELLSLIQDLQGKLPTNSSVQNAHAELIAEIQRSMRSSCKRVQIWKKNSSIIFKFVSAIFAIENLQDLLAALPDVLPAFPVLQKKLKVLVEASLFVVDKTGEA